MPAIKTSAKILASLAASAFFTPVFCAAATLIVNNEQPLDITTPPGFNYSVAGAAGSLVVPTDGFLFCGDVYVGNQPAVTPVTVVPQHGSWDLPIAQDVLSVGYNAGKLYVNRPDATTLVCRAVGPEGEVQSPLTGGIFRNGLETKMVEQFSNLVNWIPSAGFDWNNPDWSLVPTDPCNPSAQQPAEVTEDVACAAVVGSRPAVAGTTRAPTIWTATDGANFFYVARVDARFGAQQIIQDGPRPPQTTQVSGGASVAFSISDAYDRGVAGVGGGYLGDGGQFCYLIDLPTTLSANMCVGAPFSETLSGPLSNFFIYLSPPPLGVLSTSFYVAFVRPIVGAPPTLSEPAVAVSILAEPGVSDTGGDVFRGDDVAFGFLPTSTGFPWMTGGP